jgi:hypothetical protein
LKNTGDKEQWRVETYVRAGDEDGTFVIKFIDP